MAQGFPPPERWEEGDHAHTPWVGVKWGSSIALEEKAKGHAYLPTSLIEKRMGVTMATLTHSFRE